MTNDLLRERPSPGVLLLTFNRPERKNALNHAMTSAFVDEILASNHDPETRVIVVTGAGGNYSSGGDLEEFENLSLRTHPPVGQRMMEALNEATKPVIAAVEGLALGGSTTMLLHFDLVYAARRVMLFPWYWPIIAFPAALAASAVLLRPRDATSQSQSVRRIASLAAVAVLAGAIPHAATATLALRAALLERPVDSVSLAGNLRTQ